MYAGGTVVFDVNTEYKHRQVLGNETFVYDTDEVYCVWQNTLEDGLLVTIDLDFFVYDEENDCYYRESESFAERHTAMIFCVPCWRKTALSW